MGAKAGLALKGLQWFLRGIQFACAAIVLGIYSYFLAALSNHDYRTFNSIRAVEGISGAAVLYTLIALLLLCCLAGRKVTSFLAMFLDVAFIAAFVYVAVVNRHGAASCNGVVTTPFGRGRGGAEPVDNGGFTALPTYRTACRLQKACLAVSIVAIIFFILSLVNEWALARHHSKDKRFGPSPGNNYTSGYGKHAQPAKPGLFNRVFRRNTVRNTSDENALPTHTTPGELSATHASSRQVGQAGPYANNARNSYNTDATAVSNGPRHSDGMHGHNKMDTHGHHLSQDTSTMPSAYENHPANQNFSNMTNTRYGDGVYDRA